MSAQELLEIARKGRPHVRYARNEDGTAIGAWDESRGRFVTVAGLLLDGKWCSLPFELLVDGKPTPNTWVE